MWIARVHQGTGGINEYTTLDQLRKDAPRLMGLKTRGSNEAHKSIYVYKGSFSYEKEPMYLIQFYGFMSTNPNALTMYAYPKGKSYPTAIGWIGRENGAVYWTSRESNKKKRL